MQNLAHQIAQAEKQGPMMQEKLMELLLMESHFLGKTSSLDRAYEIGSKSQDPLLRAKALAAVHRFSEALALLEGVEGGEEQRASILAALGRPEVPTKATGYAELTAQASALAAVGRFEEAEHAYLEAIRDLRSTSPFPFAWVHFFRGVMWSERAGDRNRGALCYAKALEHLPQYVVANVHLAEIEAERGDVKAAIDRLKKIAEAEDPEPTALLGELERDEAKIEQAKQRYEALLAKHPLAYADHAAEFYATRNVGRAWELAKINLDNRETERSLAIAIHAARAAGKTAEACELVKRANAKKRTGVELTNLLGGCEP